jgi:hypothetical protein
MDQRYLLSQKPKVKIQKTKALKQKSQKANLDGAF